MDGNSWSFITTVALKNAWAGVVVFIPKLIVAIIVFLAGWLISEAVAKIIAGILEKISFDKIFQRSGWKDALEKAEIKVRPSEFIGTIVKWVLLIVFLLIFVEILGFTQFAIFLRQVIGWLPNLIIVAAIFVVAIIIADILEKVISASVRGIGIKYAQFLGAIVRWAIYIFAAFAILIQLGIASTIINTLITGLVAMLAIAFGLAFGLGGKDAAGDMIREIRNKLSEK